MLFSGQYFWRLPEYLLSRHSSVAYRALNLQAVAPSRTCPALTCRTVSTSSPLESSKKMIRRDKKRRQMVADHEIEKLRLKAIVKNKLLPEIVQKKAREELAKHPRDSSIARLRNRCVLTGRPRAVVREYGLCRMKFRHLADHGYISGMTRSTW